MPFKYHPAVVRPGRSEDNSVVDAATSGRCVPHRFVALRWLGLESITVPRRTDADIVWILWWVNYLNCAIHNCDGVDLFSDGIVARRARTHWLSSGHGGHGDERVALGR